MKSFEEKIKMADFSKETDLKEKLRERLFGKKNNVIQFPNSSDAVELDMDSLEYVAAAGDTFADDKSNDENKL